MDETPHRPVINLETALGKFGHQRARRMWQGLRDPPTALMAAKALKDVLKRVENWPKEAQEELAEIALEIDAALQGSAYHATPEELAGSTGRRSGPRGAVCDGAAG